MSAEQKYAAESEKPRSKVITSQNWNVQEDAETEIDLVDLGNQLLDRLHNVILCFLAGALLLNAFSYFFIEPTYESTAKLYVVSASNDSVVDLSDLNIGTSLTQDYEELILSYPVMEKVISRLDLDMDTDTLTDLVSLNNPDNTRVLEITVTTTDAQLSMDIANMLAEVSVEYLPETMSTMAPNIAQVAKAADEQAGPGYLKFTLIGGLVGALLYCAWIIVKYVMDDTIHNGEDLEKYFGLVPLTAIPENDSINHDLKQKTGAGRKKDHE